SHPWDEVVERHHERHSTATRQRKGRGVIHGGRDRCQPGSQDRCFFDKAETTSVTPPDRVGHEIAMWDQRKGQAGVEQEGRPAVKSFLKQTGDQAADVAALTPLAVRSLEGTSIEQDLGGSARPGFTHMPQGCPTRRSRCPPTASC